MITLNRFKLLEYLDYTMDDELDLSRLTKYCLSDTEIIENKPKKLK